MKNILLPLLGVVLFISVVGYFSKNVSKYGVPTIIEQETVEVRVNDAVISAEVADTPAKRERGLSGKEKLCETCGMLFDFRSEEDKLPRFWMKNMNFPIDIIWINSAKKIVGIEENVPAPPPGTSDANLELYAPPSPIEYVLEVNAGFTQKAEIKVGDEVLFPDL